MRKYVPFSSDPIFTFRSLFMQEMQKVPAFYCFHFGMGKALEL